MSWTHKGGQSHSEADSDPRIAMSTTSRISKSVNVCIDSVMARVSAELSTVAVLQAPLPVARQRAEGLKLPTPLHLARQLRRHR